MRRSPMQTTARAVQVAFPTIEDGQQRVQHRASATLDDQHRRFHDLPEQGNRPFLKPAFRRQAWISDRMHRTL